MATKKEAAPIEQQEDEPMDDQEFVQDDEFDTQPNDQPNDNQGDPWGIIAELEEANDRLSEELDIIKGMVDGENILTGNEQLPEAGGVAWTELYGTKDGHDVKINVTSRGFTSIDALTGLLECIKVANDQYKLKPYRGKANNTPPTNSPQQSTQRPAAPAPKGTPAPQQATTPTQATQVDTTTEQVLDVVKFETQPVPGGKTKCTFFAEGRQYPDIYASNTPEKLAEIMSVPGVVDWQPAHFQIAEIYEMNFQIVYRFSSKLNSRGNPYKDIVRFVY